MNQHHINPYPYPWSWGLLEPTAAVTGWEVGIHPGQVACPSWLTDKCTVKMTNVRMSLTFIPASSHVFSWQLCSSRGFTAARSETLKTGFHCLVSESRVPMRNTTAIYSLKWFRKAPLLLANRSKVFILLNTTLQFSDCGVFCFC